jgi:hypothetical protein
MIKLSQSQRLNQLLYYWKKTRAVMQLRCIRHMQIDAVGSFPWPDAGAATKSAGFLKSGREQVQGQEQRDFEWM